jgi:hygromycin-B 4-O-kinase
MRKPSVPQSSIEAVLRELWGDVSGFSRLAEGLASQAFSFRHDADEYVVRINRSIAGFEKDAYVSRKFASPALPIPEVVSIGRFDEGHAFCISRRAPGVRVHDLDARGPSRMVDPCLRIMERIAASDLSGTAGFGAFDAGGTGPCSSWKDFLTGIAEPGRFDWERAGRGVDMGVVMRMLRLVERLAGHCPEERSLVHGDFGSYNLLTDGGRITGVIDWDRALFGDPLYEVANLFFWREACMERVIRCVERPLPDVARWRERLFCYQIRIGLQEIYESAIGEGPADLAWLATRCLNIMDSTAPHDM